MADAKQAGPVEATSIVKARVARYPKGRFSRILEDSTLVVRFSEITQEVAEVVWKQALAEWGLTGESSEQSREAFIEMLAFALVDSTSKGDENLATQFKYGNKYYSVRVLADAMQGKTTQNDSYLRVFCRSWRYARLACMMVDIADNPGNMGIRQTLAVHSNGPVEHAPYMVDVFDAVIRHSGRPYTLAELDKYRQYKAYRTTQAQARAADVGLTAPTPDASSRNAVAAQSGKPGAVSAPVSDSRLNIRSVR